LAPYPLIVSAFSLVTFFPSAYIENLDPELPASANKITSPAFIVIEVNDLDNLVFECDLL